MFTFIELESEQWLKFRVRWRLDSFAGTRRMFDKVNTALYSALNEAEIEIPYPQMEVHYKDSSGQAY